MPSPWGEEVNTSHYAGHPGLLYAQRPRSFAEVFSGVQRWAERTFLIQGERRITFGDFFAAVRSARKRLEPLGIQPGERVVLLAARLTEWKGQRVLIEAARLLKERGLADVRCVLAGDAQDAGRQIVVSGGDDFGARFLIHLARSRLRKTEMLQTVEF